MTLGLFEAFGIELEYMIVDRESMQIRAIADKTIDAVAGDFVNEVTQGETSWSNELALHVIETKFSQPSPDLHKYIKHFHQDVRQINEILEPHGAMLCPTAMHPLMDPLKETKLWPHEQTEIYNQFNTIFNCQGHGWSNLQSTHINLPFKNDEEFGKLHSAIRIILPFLPALTASSPIREGQITGLSDTRLFHYQSNCKRVPYITGRVVPEPVTSIVDYHSSILQEMYKAIKPLDPKGILAHEWLNARGAIARFDRDAIEIRVLDIQECPKADLAYANLIVETLKGLCNQKLETLLAVPQDALVSLFQDCIKQGRETEIKDPALLAPFGLTHPMDLAAFWKDQAQYLPESELRETVLELLEVGTLSRRILKAVGPNPDPGKIKEVYRQLCACLAQNSLF